MAKKGTEIGRGDKAETIPGQTLHNGKPGVKLHKAIGMSQTPAPKNGGTKGPKGPKGK